MNMYKQSIMKTSKFIVYIEQDEDGVFIGTIPNLPNCHAQGDTKEEMLANLEEVAYLTIRNSDNKDYEPMKFIGTYNLELNNA
jgi:predicted RNase H-like HicB family nuclease